MIRRPPRSTRTDTLFPYTTLFRSLPNLIERAGTSVSSGGSITAIYTVLADGDDGNDPVVDSARSILDGHIVLSRPPAERGVYPAIDLGPSVRRVMTDIRSEERTVGKECVSTCRTRGSP